MLNLDDLDTMAVRGAFETLWYSDKSEFARYLPDRKLRDARKWQADRSLNRCNASRGAKGECNDSRIVIETHTDAVCCSLFELFVDEGIQAVVCTERKRDGWGHHTFTST